MVFHYQLFEKAYFIVEVTGQVTVQPASSDFRKAPLAMHEVKMAEFCPTFVVIVVGNASYQQRQWQKKEANILYRVSDTL